MRISDRAVLSAAVLIGLLSGARAGAATFEVTRGDDPVPDGCLAGDCSLREALEDAVATPGADSILLGAGLYSVSRGELPVIGEIAIEGGGSGTTSVVGAGAFDLLHVTALSQLTLTGVALSAPQESAVIAENSAAILRDVRVQAGGGVVFAESAGGFASLRAEQSQLADAVACLGDSASCEVVDSELNQVLISGDEIALLLDRVDVVGPPSMFGVSIGSNGPVTIRDSTIRDQTQPLVLAPTGARGADVRISRTRFIGNRGPMSGERDSNVYLDDVEFRDNIVDDDHLTYPAVLVAQPGPGWRIARALFVGNRGGGGSGSNYNGAVVRAFAGSNVVMNNVTFDDNTFRFGVDGFGDTIGVNVGSGASTIFWLLQATMRRAVALPEDAPASLLAVNGAAANVRIFNSLLLGTCTFESGAALFQAEGNIESSGDTCGMDPASNDVDVAPVTLHLGALADNGGFTETLVPELGSVLRDAAVPIWCLFNPLDQRRYVRPAGGVDCDIGAVEADALPDTLFANGFES